MFRTLLEAVFGFLLLASPALADIDRSPVVHLTSSVADGTGFYIGNQLYVTAGHVCETTVDGNIKYTIGYSDGESAGLNDIVVYDSIHDYCVIHSRDLLNPNTALKFDCSYRPTIGDTVYVTGYPGPLPVQTTFGHVSALVSSFAPYWPDVYFADMTIAPGVSGSPVFEGNGSVIGILVGGLPDNRNYSMIVPVTYLCGLNLNEDFKIIDG